jgi:hypothetical protein
MMYAACELMFVHCADGCKREDNLNGAGPSQVALPSGLSGFDRHGIVQCLLFLQVLSD